MLPIPPGIVSHGSSAGLGWQGLFTSFEQAQGGTVFGSPPPGQDERIVLFRSTPSMRWRDGRRWVTPRTTIGTVHLVPSLSELTMSFEGDLQSQTIIVGRDVLLEVASEFIAGDPDKIRLRLSMFQASALQLHLFESIGEAMQSKSPASAIFAEYAVRAVAAQLLTAWSAEQGRAIVFPPKRGRSRTVAKAMDFMQSRLSFKQTLQMIASAAGVSITTLCHEFRVELGMAPHKALVNLRLKQAQDLLAKQGPSLSDIAEQCGFASQEHMTLVFRRHLGITPGAYRKTLSE